MKRRIILCAAMFMAAMANTFACTNLIAGIPFIHFQHRSLRVGSSRIMIEFSEQAIRVSRIGNDRRAIGRRILSDNQVSASEGESFTIADPNEIWIMEMIGKGPGIRGAVWVAVRVPDDCISAHANQSRIHQFDMNDKENCMYSPDVVSFAREKGYFNGVNKDFSFSLAYAPLDFGARRFCTDSLCFGFTKRGIGVSVFPSI